MEKALENARSITNVEIQYDDMLWIKGMPDAPPPFTNDYIRISHITYIASGEKYRAETRNESAQSTNILKFEEEAFDGKLWAEWMGDNPVLMQQDGDNPNDGENGYNPLIQPFLFLSRSSDDCLPGSLRFIDLRSPDILDGLILPDAQSSNGMFHLSFPGLPRNGVNQLWTITMDAADPDFTPRTISKVIYAGNRLRTDTETTYILSDYTNLGAYHFPTKIAFSELQMPTNELLAPTLAATGMVTMVSVKMPTEITDASFRIDESVAPHIMNTAQFKGYGVGLILAEAGSNIVVNRIIADSPAGRQNELHAGDRILSIAESNAPAVAVHPGKADLPRAMARLQGAKGSTVRLTFVPSGKDDPQTNVVTFVRGEVRGRLGGAQIQTNGMKAPDMAMITLTNRTTEHLSDYAGKIVVLEFWASWCPPCRKNMADLQLDPARYPNWQDKVVLIAASIDDTADIAAKRIQESGWNQTHNVWLGDKDIKTYHIGGIPFAYVIDAKGTIIISGIPGAEGLNIPDIVNRQLDTARQESKKD